MIRWMSFSILLLTVVAVSLGEEPAAGLVTVKLRVTGLFQPDRVQDLRDVMELIPDAKLVSVDYDNAEAVFEYDPRIAFNKTPPEKFAERLDNAVRMNSRSTFTIKPLSTTPKEKLEHVEIGVLGLDCKGCALGAYEAVAKIDGVVQATVSFKDELLKAKIDPEKTNREALEAALMRIRVELKKP